MGLLSSSVSISRFSIKGALPSDYLEQYPLQIRRHGFRELDENSAEDRSVGWVNLLDVLDNEFIGEEFFKENFITLSLRIDVRKVPQKALKYYCMLAENEQKARLNKEYLAKAARQEIRERVYFQLLKRVIPQCNVYDMMWNLNQKTVVFSSQSNPVCEEFSKRFKETFGLSLIALFPYTLAEKHLSENQLSQVEQTQPYSFY